MRSTLFSWQYHMKYAERKWKYFNFWPQISFEKYKNDRNRSTSSYFISRKTARGVISLILFKYPANENENYMPIGVVKIQR